MRMLQRLDAVVMVACLLVVVLIAALSALYAAEAGGGAGEQGVGVVAAGAIGALAYRVLQWLAGKVPNKRGTIPGEFLATLLDLLFGADAGDKGAVIDDEAWPKDANAARDKILHKLERRYPVLWRAHAGI